MKTKKRFEKVSIFEAIGALRSIYPETEEDYNNIQIIYKYLEQQREKTIK